MEATNIRRACVGGVWLVASLLLVLACISSTQAQQHTYPEEVHRLVVERLGHRGGGGGTWGEWSGWSPCSRSCGGGVSIQSRECLMNTGRHRIRTRRHVKNVGCVGLYKRFQLCNVQTCPGGYSDFRREQCAAFNKTPFNRRFYTWEPYYDTPESCALNCRAVGLSFYATLNQTVLDGTACGVRSANKICVSGMCMGLGCDGVLGSGKTVDTCGQCGGDNSTCRVIAGIFSRARMPYGYNIIATLPVGATNITIQHTKPSTNYLALRIQGGDFFINGNWAVNRSGNYVTAGTTFYYQRPEMFTGDKVTAAGPLHLPVDVMLFFQSTNPGIQYEYRLPMSPSSLPSSSSSGKVVSSGVVPGTPQRPRHFDNPLNPLVPGGPASRTPPSGPVNDARSSHSHGNSIHSRRKEEEEEEAKKKKERKGKHGKGKKRDKKRRRYEWKVVGFSRCTETCGGGTQTTRVVCVKRKKGNEVPSKHCQDLPKPSEETVRCNLRPCPAEWMPEPWGPCSVTCGMGVQTRALTCKMRVSPGHEAKAPEGACSTPPSIAKAQVCELRACNSAPAWRTGEWGPCSSQCGLGTRHRSVTCVTDTGEVPVHLCPADERPSNQELCDMGSCATDTWFFSKWEDRCSEECGDGVQRRRVHCSGDALDNLVTETSCNPEQRPASTRSCTSDRGCGGKWFTGPWGECESQCGPGRQTRAVVCVVWGRGQWRTTTDVSQCKGQPRPDTTQGCTTPCQAEWYTSEWSQCSVSCSGGVQRREVKCLSELLEPALTCTSASKPDTRQPCNTQSCHQAAQADESAVNASVSDQAPSESQDLADQDSGRKPSGVCIDRMKNCHLVYKARLCRLKYYNKLCCETCTKNQ